MQTQLSNLISLLFVFVLFQQIPLCVAESRAEIDTGITNEADIVDFIGILTLHQRAGPCNLHTVLRGQLNDACPVVRYFR